MPPDHESKPDERHADLVAVANAIAAAKKLLGLFVAAVVPLMVVGVWTLIANHFQQKRLIEQVTDMKQSMHSITYRIDRINEKVIVMWAGGKWSQSYDSTDDETQARQ